MYFLYKSTLRRYLIFSQLLREWLSTHYPISEPELRDQFHRARADAGAGDAPDAASTDVLIRDSERRVVDQVGGIGAEVQVHTLGEPEDFVQ
jgi:hypothetical protein